MSKSGLTLEIESFDNEAFADNPHEEVARILREAADSIASGKEIGVLRDLNGNRVGSWALTLPESDQDLQRQRG